LEKAFHESIDGQQRWPLAPWHTLLLGRDEPVRAGATAESAAAGADAELTFALSGARLVVVRPARAPAPARTLRSRSRRDDATTDDPQPGEAAATALPDEDAHAPPPPDSHPGRLIDPRECPDTVEVKFIATNPKRPGTACNLRYEAYKDATTVKEFLEKGGWRADLVHDVNKNYCALGGAVPTGTPPPPTSAGMLGGPRRRPRARKYSPPESDALAEVDACHYS